MLLASVTLAVVLLAGGCSENEPVLTQTSPAKPNFVFILSDDMRKDDLKYMPKTRALLQEKGISFTNIYVSNPLCCPSRATIMRGQYAHNTGVWTNPNSTTGGWQAYKQNGNEKDTVATRLHNAGYRTALIGKYLNGYNNTRNVPQGWDKWFADFILSSRSFDYFNYDINDNGTIRHFGVRDHDYLTDVLRRETRSFIGASVAQGKPFFAYVAPIAPHGGGPPAPRDEHTYDGVRGPRLPSFNEADVSDKPPWIRKLPRLSDRKKASINKRNEDRAERLQALDDLVEGVVDKLRDSGQLKNTYIVFTSDNGNHMGEHRIPSSKGRPYEEDVNMPLLVRGPGVAAGSTTAKLALNTDFFPTFTDLAGIQTPNYVDGRSLRPILKGSTATAWRTAILLEHRNRYPGHVQSSYASGSFYGIRTSEGMKYIEYSLGPQELYDLNTDPYELTSSREAPSPPKGLDTRLEALKGCAGGECRAAENRPYSTDQNT
ncbi:MAG: sulfatase [Actinomycetota bacterium]|nr:sulfatase [Actinomycetota bacterium]